MNPPSRFVRHLREEGLIETICATKNHVVEHTYERLVRGLRLRLACDLPNELPDTLDLGHATGIVISQHAEIGDNVRVYQNVTIGSKSRNPSSSEYPAIGDDVVIYSGAVVLGDVTVGENCAIGANSVVLEDVPPNSIVVGAPARVVGDVD